MQAIRATVILCITSLMIAVCVLVFLNNQDRYVLLPQNKSMFVFDKKSAVINYCTDKNCQLVLPNGYGDVKNMSVNMGQNGQVNVQPVTPNVANNGFMPTSPMMMATGMQAAIPQMVMTPQFSTSLQTMPNAFSPAFVPAGMQAQQTVMVPSAIVPTAMKTSANKTVQATAINNNASSDDQNQDSDGNDQAGAGQDDQGGQDQSQNDDQNGQNDQSGQDQGMQDDQGGQDQNQFGFNNF